MHNKLLEVLSSWSTGYGLWSHWAYLSVL